MDLREVAAFDAAQRMAEDAARRRADARARLGRRRERGRLPALLAHGAARRWLARRPTGRSLADLPLQPGVFVEFDGPRLHCAVSAIGERGHRALTVVGLVAAPALAGLSDLIVQNSLVAALEPDPASLQKGHDVRATREVMSGHYVRVDPQPLKEPYYIAHSEAMCAELGLDADVCKSESMIKIFSGDAAEARAHGFERGWATAYALSIYGKEMLPNNAGRNGWG